MWHESDENPVGISGRNAQDESGADLGGQTQIHQPDFAPLRTGQLCLLSVEAEQDVVGCSQKRRVVR